MLDYDTNHYTTSLYNTYMQPHAPPHYTHSNTLLLRGLRGRSASTLSTLFAECGTVKLLRVIARCNVALVVYAREDEARAAREALSGEDLVYTKVGNERVIELIRNNYGVIAASG